MLSAISFNLDQSKILSSGNELKVLAYKLNVAKIALFAFYHLQIISSFHDPKKGGFLKHCGKMRTFW